MLPPFFSEGLDVRFFAFTRGFLLLFELLTLATTPTNATATSTTTTPTPSIVLTVLLFPRSGAPAPSRGPLRTDWLPRELVA